MKKSDYAMKVCGLILLLIVIVSLFVGVVSAEGIITDNTTIEDANVAQLAPLNPDFLAYLENPPEASYGYIQPPMDLSHLDQLPVVGLPTLYALPSSFDWRDQSKVTPVKDQNYCGTCWDFGTTSVLESAVLIDESVAHDFSEHSVALCVDRSWYYLYDGATDPCQAGGWSCLASEVFIKKGSVLETCNPYECSSLNCDGSCVCDICPPVKKVDGYIVATNDGSQIEVIKNAVYNHGPVTMAFYYTPSGGYSVEPWGIIYDYYPCSGSANHLVSIIGWDDAVLHPNPSHAGTGAWIVKNSWGTGWGNEGFFYLAYDSSCVREIAYLKYKDDNPGEELLYWDEAGHVGSMGYWDNSAWMANVFTATQSGDLTHVDFWTTSNNAQYELYVWNGFFGTELAYKTGNCQEYGYYSIPLNEPISIDAGQQFTVGIKMTTPSYDYPIPIEYKITGWVDPPIQTSVSFIRHTASGTWTDLANYDRNACLRARLTILVPPEITSFAPPSPVSDTVCTWRTFSVTVNQIVNVDWYLSNTLQHTNESVREASYTLHANVPGVHNVSAIASNANGADMQSWVWNVTPSAIAYLKRGPYGDSDYDLYIYTAPTTLREHGTLIATDYWSPDGSTVGITAIGMNEIAYLKRGPYGDSDYDLYIYTAPTTLREHGTLIATDYWSPDGNTVGITAIGIDEIAYLKKGPYGDTDYDLFIYTAPTTLREHGTLIASDCCSPDGSTVGITAIDIDSDGIDEIAYLKKGPYGDRDYDLYIYTAPTTIGEHGTLTASDYWSPDGNSVAIAAIDIDGDGLDEIAYLKKGPSSDWNYNIYIYTAPTTIGEHGTLIASDYWSPDGQTEGISVLG